MWVHSAPVFIILLALLPVFVWDTVKLSHRLAGPMYRFHKTVQRLAAGEEVEPIKLRKGDPWNDFAIDFNAMVERFNSRSPDNQNADGDLDSDNAAAADHESELLSCH